MNKLKAFGISIILFIIFVGAVLIITTKVVIPLKLDIGKSIKTPSVVGLELSEAKQQLRKAGFTFSDSLSIEWVNSPKYPDRSVISQFPRANKIVKNPNRIKLEVSTGGKQVIIPSVLEENAINASSKIKQLGLEVDFVRKNYGLYDQNTVVEVSPEVGTKVLKGSNVILYLESEIEDIPEEIDSLAVPHSEQSATENIDDNNESKQDNLTIEDILQDN